MTAHGFINSSLVFKTLDRKGLIIKSKCSVGISGSTGTYSLTQCRTVYIRRSKKQEKLFIMEEFKELNQSEIEFISEKAKHSILNNPGFIGKFTKHALDILSISPNKKLIFIQGDDYVGLDHINKRHRYFTNAYSMSDNKFIKTSRFDRSLGTLFDYHRISEYLFDENNLNLVKNKSPEKFNLYEKTIDFFDCKTYCLIVYRGSKIVHTLFPVEKGKKSTKFRKENINVEYKENNYARVVIPYLDVYDIIHYGIGIKIFHDKKIEKWDLLIYKESNLYKIAVLGEFSYTCQFSIESRIEQLNYMNVSYIEKLIYDLDKKKQDKI